MKIYNTLSKSKEEFIPLEENKVKIYVCGPTVYNLIHIGNARPMIFFDTVRRYFIHKGYDVKFVSNFTDVDDKIIKRAIEENSSSDEVSKKYIAECKKDMENMNILPADVHPLATEEIDGMKDMISTLIEKNHAYAASDGTVYFRVSSFSEYGKLSHKNIDELQSGFRKINVRGEENKESNNDFVLWKPKKEGEPYWHSPWSDGRPGWHIECSVMSKKYLGEQIDIHGGGEDLIFPHHENEIAQSEAASGKSFAKYWMHNAFLNIDNKKMSKSAGNFFTVRDIAEKYDLNVLRFLMLSAHYRNPLNFSDDLMESAKRSLERIIVSVERMDSLKDKINKNDALGLNLKEEVDKFIESFEAAMDDDFNTADAISFLFEAVKYANVNIDENSDINDFNYVYDTIKNMAYILGIKTKRKDENIDDKVKELIDKRQEARKSKDFALADKIRDELFAMGIILEDTREGVKWRKA